MAEFHFRRGFTYVAGIDKPVVVSKSAIVEAVTDMGFRVLFADECSRMPSFPFRVPGKCDDEWDWVGYVERVGPSETIDVPGQVKWIQEVPKPLPPPQPGQPVPPPPMPPTWSNPDPAPAEPAATKTAAAKGSIWLPIIIGGAAGILLVKLLRGR